MKAAFLQPILRCVVRLRPLEAVIVITATTEEVRRRSIWGVMSVEKGGLGWKTSRTDTRVTIQTFRHEDVL